MLEKKRFQPTDIGRIVSNFLTKYFTQYVDYQFTANLEDQLDEIARGEKQWIPVLEKFWGDFHQKIIDIGESVKRADVTTEILDEKCPKCQHPLSLKLGKHGRFIACTHYPECDYTANVTEEGETVSTEPEVVEDRTCPKCDSALHIKTGRYGKFIGCSSYPKCKHMEPLLKPKDTEVQCPDCKKATILERKSRKGKIFYSCARYPKCKYALWDLPLNEPCPKCNWPILTLKTTKKSGEEKICPQKDCDYRE